MSYVLTMVYNRMDVSWMNMYSIDEYLASFCIPSMNSNMYDDYQLILWNYVFVFESGSYRKLYEPCVHGQRSIFRALPSIQSHFPHCLQWLSSMSTLFTKTFHFLIFLPSRMYPWRFQNPSLSHSFHLWPDRPNICPSIRPSPVGRIEKGAFSRGSTPTRFPRSSQNVPKRPQNSHTHAEGVPLSLNRRCDPFALPGFSNFRYKHPRPPHHRLDFASFASRLARFGAELPLLNLSSSFLVLQVSCDISAAPLALSVSVLLLRSLFLVMLWFGYVVGSWELAGSGGLGFRLSCRDGDVLVSAIWVFRISAAEADFMCSWKG